MDRISLVMVAYNEHDHIKQVIEEYYSEVFVRLPKGSQFIIYLDGPTDGTAEIVHSLEKKYGLEVVDCAENRGYFYAAKTALSYARYDVFFSDSSGKHHASDFWAMLPYLDDYDIVNGLRSPRYDTRYRQVLSLGQRLFVSALFFIPLYDHNTGYKLIRKEVLDRLLDRCRVLPVTFSAELIIRAHSAGFKIKDVPVAFSKRSGAEKQFAIRKLPKALIKTIFGYLMLWMVMLNEQD